MEISPEQIRFAYEFMEKADPLLWKTCYPRIYTEPKCGIYYSPKTPSQQMAGVAIKIREGMIGESEQYEFIACSQLARFGVPMFWLSRDIAAAIRQTVPPQEIDWYNMPMPFEAGIFMLPKGAFVHPDEGDIAFVAYSRLRTGEIRQSTLVPGRPYGSINGGMTFLALSMTGGHLFHWNLPLDVYTNKIRIPDLDSLVMDHLGDHLSGFKLMRQPHMTLTDNHTMAEVAHYVFGSILLMNGRPDLLTPAKLQKRVMHKGVSKEFWSPNIIGEHYRIKHEVVAHGGTHASPRFHWVRGSYKEQPWGPKLSLRKTIWIEPYMRGV